MYSLLPMYQRVGKAAFKKNLDNILALCDYLGNPHQKFKSIHIAGTNGKGSVTHILAACLIEEGYKVGYYTSPHLVDFRERIKINNEMISKENVVSFVESHQEIIEQLQPSFFEITVAMAFDHFANSEVDYAIIETGLGGRLDSTNIITPLLSVITNIGHDHMDMLGDTLEKIAFEKAGIIKQGVPVIIGERQDEIEHVFENRSKELRSEIFWASDVFTSEWIDSDLKGFYQQINIRTALKALEVMNSRYSLKSQHWRNALKHVGKLTGFKGRWQILSEKPYLIIDTGHNEEGIKQMLKNLAQLNYNKLYFIFGMVDGKELKKVLKQFPQEAKYCLVKPNVPRGLEVETVLKASQELEMDSQPFTNISKAYEFVKTRVTQDDCILVGGSTFTVADFLSYYEA